MHCQKATAEQILERGGNYVLAGKGNQETPLEDIQLLLDDPDAAPDELAQTVDGDHGRIETRRAARFSCAGRRGLGRGHARDRRQGDYCQPL